MFKTNIIAIVLTSDRGRATHSLAQCFRCLWNVHSPLCSFGFLNVYLNWSLYIQNIHSLHSLSKTNHFYTRMWM